MPRRYFTQIGKLMTFKPYHVIAQKNSIISGEHYIVKGERYRVTGRAPKFKLIIEKDSNNKKVFVHASLFKKESKITRVKKYILEKIYIIFGRG